MNKRTLIFTTSKSPWFTNEFEDIKRIQEQSKGMKIVGYDVRTIDLKSIPLEKGNDGKMRPSWVWFKDTFTKNALEYNEVALHISDKERDKFGISKNIGGTYQRDNDNVIEFWFCADKGDVAKNYKGKSEFWRRFLHESGHGSERWLLGNKVDIIHNYDYNLHALPDAYKLFDWTQWSILKERVAYLTDTLSKLLKPFTPPPKPTQLLPLVKRKQLTLLDWCTRAGVPIKVTSEFRSFDEQDALYAQGRTTNGSIITNARGGESAHNYGVAFDIAFIGSQPYEGNWNLVGLLGETLGLEWGGRWDSFPDKPHFQLMLGYSLKDFQSGKVDYNKYK